MAQAPPDSVAPKVSDPQEIYLESMMARLTGWGEPRARLERAFSGNEFVLFAQPIVLLAQPAKPAALEVLVRLREEEDHSILPGAFIPVLEQHRMMGLLDRWVVRSAVKWLGTRPEQERPLLFVNLSADSLGSASFPGFVQQALAATGVPGSHLCFELPLDLNLSPDRKSGAVVQGLSSLECRLAIGGFGRDPVSFKPVQSARAAYVKIDGSVTRSLLTDKIAQAKIASIAKTCNGAGIGVIAEFVESDEVAKRIRELGVSHAQGWSIGQARALG